MRPFSTNGVAGPALQQVVLQRAAGIAPHNRPYVFNGVQDCYGYVRQVWNAVLSDGSAHAEDFYPNAYNRARWLSVAGGLPVADAPSAAWVYFSDPGALLPGDVLSTAQGHAWGATWHGGIYAGVAGGQHYQWDNSSSANGAYKRPLWSGFRYYYRPTHDLLAQASPPAQPATAEWRALALVPGSAATYAMDSWGGIHPHDGALALDAMSGYWPGWSIARDIVVLPGGGGGYKLDGWGGIHPFHYGGGTAPAASGYAYWEGWDIARRLALLADGSGGYVLDGFGGIHPFAIGNSPSPPAAAGNAYWNGWDIARDITLLADGSGGYVLDGFGGVHPFALGNNPGPPAAAGNAYWNGWDIARALVLLPGGGGGYVLDGFGGIHPFAIGGQPGPPPTDSGPYWNGQDVARDLVLTSPKAGYVLDSQGGVHSFSVP